jgi:hypothetical protein
MWGIWRCSRPRTVTETNGQRPFTIVCKLVELWLSAEQDSRRTDAGLASQSLKYAMVHVRIAPSHVAVSWNASKLRFLEDKKIESCWSSFKLSGETLQELSCFCPLHFSDFSPSVSCDFGFNINWLKTVKCHTQNLNHKMLLLSAQHEKTGFFSSKAPKEASAWGKQRRSLDLLTRSLGQGSPDSS